MFKTAAIDNLDHNPSFATPESSFHGTTISVFQHTDYHYSELTRTILEEENKINFQYHT